MVLDPALLAAVADLELVARVTVDGTLAGLHRSPFHGYSAEFSQYRHYRPGDDLRHVDWKLYARTDRIYTKQYRETTNMVAQVAVDASASMGFAGRSGVSKLTCARLLAAALSHLVVRQGDAAGLVVFDEAVRQYLPPRGGQAHLKSLLVALSRVVPSSGTATIAAVRRATDLMRRRGVLILLSDLYDEGEGLDAELRRAASMGHEVAVFHVLTRDELDFPFRDEAELEDMETGRRVLAGGGAAVESYREQIAAFLARWRERCARHGIDYAQVIADEPLDKALRPWLLRRTMTGLRA